MKPAIKKEIAEAKSAALEVLLHNAHGPYHGLPRTAGWGYPEPYTRDLMIAALGLLVTNNQKLLQAMRKTLESTAQNQSPRGHIPSLAHDPDDRGASDTTPLFLMAVAMFRETTGETSFLESAIQKALRWMEYQSPADDGIVAQLPTSDWRDEQWVLGYGLFVNTVVYTYLRQYARHAQADRLREAMSHFVITSDVQHQHVHEGLLLPHKPYYALWSYKVMGSERFDLLGNSLAILSGIAAPSRALELVRWIESECDALRESRELAVDLPPNFFPYIRPGDPDWRPRYEHFNLPGEYHNGGIWPFICGFYIAALVAVGRTKLAERKLVSLTQLIRQRRKEPVDFGFNEWHQAQNGAPRGQDWQTWSAAMYLYAARCVEENHTPFFDAVRNPTPAGGR